MHFYLFFHTNIYILKHDFSCVRYGHTGLIFYMFILLSCCVLSTSYSYIIACWRFAVVFSLFVRLIKTKNLFLYIFFCTFEKQSRILINYMEMLCISCVFRLSDTSKTWLLVVCGMRTYCWPFQFTGFLDLMHSMCLKWFKNMNRFANIIKPNSIQL